MNSFLAFLLGLVTFVVVVIVAVALRKRYVRKREEAQFLADEEIILNLCGSLGKDEVQTYKELPNRKSRMDWLKLHYPDFVVAADRHYKNGDLTGVAAIHLDLRLIKNAFQWVTRDEVIRHYQNDTSRISLNEYQELVDARNIDYKAMEEDRAQRLAQERAEREARMAKQRAEEKLQKEAAKSYWNSLSKDQQEAFKKAKGASARKSSLPSTAQSGYSADILYPFIIANEFSNLNPSTDYSIDYCESPSFTHQSFDGGGHHTSYDGGGHSYSDGGASSFSDGGASGGGDC